MKNRSLINIKNLKKLKAIFEIEAVFTITGRGLIFTGKVKNGVLGIGHIILFKVNDEVFYRKIIGIEIASRGKNPKSNRTGILIKTIDEEEINYLKTWQPNNYLADIYQLPKED